MLPDETLVRGSKVKPTKPERLGQNQIYQSLDSKIGERNDEQGGLKTKSAVFANCNCSVVSCLSDCGEGEGGNCNNPGGMHCS